MVGDTEARHLESAQGPRGCDWRTWVTGVVTGRPRVSGVGTLGLSWFHMKSIPWEIPQCETSGDIN